MAGEDEPTQEGSLWIPIDLAEELERVQRHLAMFKDMLETRPSDVDLSGGGSTVVHKIMFDRMIYDNDMCSLSPYVYAGFLLGIDASDDTPVVIVGNVKESLYVADEEDEEPEIDMLVSETEQERVPIREMNEIWGASATPDGWEAHERRGWDRN